MNRPYSFDLVVKVALLSISLILTLSGISSGQTYKIMPLGDSITRGVVGSSTPGGYRDDLKDRLTNEYVNTDFVGSLQDGSFSDPQHEGHDAATVTYIDDNVTTWVSNASPDFVLLLTGTNDLGLIHNEIIANKISSICDKIYSVNSSTTIFLSSILPRGDNTSKDSLATQINRLIKKVAVDKLSAGYSIYYVGNNELFKRDPDWAINYMFDGIHPNDTGYNLMAQLFWSAIMNIIKKGAEIVIDNFNRSEIGIAWDYDPAFVLQTIAPGQRELQNSSVESRWNILAVYKAVNNPGEVSIRWGQNATAEGIENGGLVLRLNKASTTANGYLLRVKQTGMIELWTIVNGSPYKSITEAEGTQPKPGQVFKVVLSSDAVAHHFHCYIDGKLVGTASDFGKQRGNEPELYAGVMLRGSLDGVTKLENNIDDFNLQIIGDIKPPVQVKDLQVVSTSASTVTLAWTAPGDDSLSDQASFYDIRYSKIALTENNWNDATKATDVQSPAAPRSTESMVVMGLAGNTHYYFGLKTADEEYNWSPLSNVVDVTTSGGTALQKVDEFNDPNTLTQWWSANPVYVIQNGELKNTSTTGVWGHLAVFKANVNPVEASIKWSKNATPEGIDRGAIALLLDKDNYATANGYMAWIRTTLGDDPYISLFTLKAGSPDVALGSFKIVGAKKPGPEDVFKVSVTSDGSGYHFDFSVNEKFYGRLNDPDKTYSNGTDYYMGIELHGNMANSVDRFITVNTVGEPKNIEKVKPQGTPTGIVGKPFTDSLVVRVTDKSGNFISGVPVDFTVTQGGGYVDVQQKDNYVRMEAEEYKVIESPMEIGVDPEASKGKFIMPNGGDPLQGKAEYNFYAREAGSYVMWCRMSLPNNTRMSLFVQIDDKPPITIGLAEGVWDFQTYEPGPWEWRVVYDRVTNDVAIYNLTKGNHKLTITQRAATGVRIDKILLSNNYSYVPSGLEDVPQYKTDALGQARALFTPGTIAGENRIEAISPGYTLTGSPVVFVINGNADTPVSMVPASVTSMTGVGGQPLAQPFEVALKDKYGNAAANYTIKFTVTEGDGFLSNGKTVHEVSSDNNGKAATYLTLGTESTNNKVVASYSTLTPITFAATATSGIANAMQYESGNSQSGKVGTTLANPLSVKIIDNIGNSVVNHNVHFQIKAGGGSLVPTAGSTNIIEGAIDTPGTSNVMNYSPAMDVLTKKDGIASVRLVVGYTAGVNTVEATSNAGSTPFPPIQFNATAAPDIPDTLAYVSGNNQTGAAGMRLSKPFIVKVTDHYNNPIYGHKVQFGVAAGEGYLDGNTDRTKLKLTDPEGKTQVYLTVGQTPGVLNKVTAESFIGEEILLNPGFETPGSGGLDLFANWTIELHGSSTISDEQSQVHGGAHACRINVVAGAEYQSSIIQDVTLTSGQEYDLSLWGKLTGATQIAYCVKNKDTIRWWKESTQEWVDGYTLNTITLSSDYEQKSVVIKAQNSGTNYQIHFRPMVSTNHTVYLDDISLTLKTGSGYNYSAQYLDAEQSINPTTMSFDMIAGLKPLRGSPITFQANVGTVTAIQAKSPSNHEGSASCPLADSLEVYIKDNYGNPVGGYPVTFSSTEGENPGTFNGYTLHEIVTNTDDKGIARVWFFCGIKPGVPSSAKASAKGLTGSPVPFAIAVAELVELKYVDGDSQGGTVGAVLPEPLKARVIDQKGKDIPKYPITFKVIKGGGNFSGDSTVIIASDTTTKVAAVKFTLGPAPGNENNVVEASAVFKGKALNGSPVRYVASASIGSAEELVEVSGNYKRAVVGNPLDEPFVVKVADHFTNPIAGQPVIFTVKTGGGFLDGDPAKKTTTKFTDSNGKAQVILTVGTVAGINNNAVEIVAYKPASQTHLKNSPMTFYASTTASAARSLSIVFGENQPRSPVRTALPQPFGVKVKDKENNAVPNHPVQWKVVQGGGTFDGLMDSIKTVNTNENGISQVYYYPGPIAGLQNIVRAHSWNQVELEGSPKTFVVDTKAGPVSTMKSIVSATSPVPADGTTKSTITVITTDDWGNKIPDKVLGILNVTGSNNIPTSFMYPTNADGQAIAYLASTRAETKVISIRDITDGIDLKDTARVRFTPLEAYQISYVSGTDQSGNFGTAVTDPIKAVVTDIYGNPIYYYPVFFETYEGGGYIWECREGKPVYTNENGIAAAYWVLGPSAQVNRARAYTQASLVGSGNVRYIATGQEGTAASLRKEGVDITRTGTAGLLLTDPLTVKVVDQKGYHIFDYPVKFKITFGDGNFDEASEVTIKTDPFGNANVRLTLGRVAGSNVVSAEAPGLANSPIGFTFQGLPGEAAKMVNATPERKSGPVGGQITDVKVKVMDIFDNAVSGYTINFAVNRGDATVNGASSDASDPNGIASVNLIVGKTVGEIEVIAAAPGLIGDGLKIKVYGVAATAVSMQAYYGNDQQGTIERELVYPLSVVVLDQFGNPAGGQTVPVAFVGTQGNGILLDGPTVYADENGIAAARFQLGSLTGPAYRVWAINNGLTGSPIEFKATGVVNKFPIIPPIENKTIRENQNIRFSISATDDDNDPIRYGAHNLPQGALFDSLGTREFSWTPSYFQSGKYIIHFIAKDSKDGFDDQPVTVKVENVNRMPLIVYYEPIATTLVGHKEVGEPFHFMVQANDPDNDVLTYEWFNHGILVSSKNYYDFNAFDMNLGYHYIVVKVSDGFDTVQRDWALYIKTPVQLAHFSGQLLERQGVELEWETTVEVAHAGFNILRRSASEEVYEQLNQHLISSDGTKHYRYIDRNVKVGETYSYKLIDVSMSGEQTGHDPITVFVARPKAYKLYQNYPNPFNPITHIDYQLPVKSLVIIKIYNIVGQEVRTLMNEVQEAGYHSVMWNGLDNYGVSVSSGIFYYRMETKSYVEVKKMVLLR